MALGELEQENAKLRDADRLKTKFLCDAAHELRTPIAAIIAAAKIIRKHYRTNPDAVERFSATILAEGDRIARLINEFLDLAKIESNCVSWDDTNVEVPLLLSRIVEAMDPLAQSNGILLVCDVAEDLPSIRVDEDRIIQVLTNIISNALKHTPSGGSITLRAGCDRDGAVHFAVADTGEGIPQDELVKIFERFHQVHESGSRGRPRGGSGLGLPIAREIVEHYGGRIWAESRLNVGTTLSFTIPPHYRGSTSEAAAHYPQCDPAIDALLLTADPALASVVARVPSASGVTFTVCTTWEAAERATAAPRAVVIVGADWYDREGPDIAQRVQSLGVPHVMVYSPEKGLWSPAQPEGIEMVARSLGYLTKTGARVLVAEDDARYREVLEYELKQAGYEVLVAGDGREALSLLQRTRPDAVVLDLVMPGIDGLAVLDAISAEGASMPVVVLTALADADVSSTARQLGASRVVHKTGDPGDEIVARVTRALTGLLPSTAVGAK